MCFWCARGTFSVYEYDATERSFMRRATFASPWEACEFICDHYSFGMLPIVRVNRTPAPAFLRRHGFSAPIDVS